MTNKKSILEQALLDAQKMENAFKSLGKEMISRTMKEDIEELIKESLEGIEDEEEGSMDADLESDTEVMDTDVDMDSEMDDMDTDVDMDVDGLDTEMGMDVEIDGPEDELDMRSATPEELISVFKKMNSDDKIVIDKSGEQIHLKDDEDDVEYIIKEEDLDEEDLDETIYEIEMEEDEDLMEDEDLNFDEVEDDELESDLSALEDELMSDDEDEDLFDDDDDEFSDDDDDELISNDEDGLDEETLYEIELDEDEMMDEDEEFDLDLADFNLDEMEDEEEALEEGGTPRTHAALRKAPTGKKISQTTRANAKSRVRDSYRLNESKQSLTEAQKKVRLYENEVKNLKAKNEDYKQALKMFKNKLEEIRLLEANLVNTNKLFTEHATTKQEKLSIISRFDKVKSVEQSNTLYEMVKDQLVNKKTNNLETISEGFNKISGSSRSKLVENKIHEDPQFARIKEIMNKIK